METKYPRLTGFILLIALVFFFSACTASNPTSPGSSGSALVLGGNAELATQELKEFTSTSELQQFLLRSSLQNNYQGGVLNSVRSFAVDEGIAVSATQTKQPTDVLESYAEDYSQTNVQVAGVDEADYVKNDDRYIYLISNNDLVIVDAYDAENAKIVHRAKIAGIEQDTYHYGNARQLFLHGDKLVVMVQANERSFSFRAYDITAEPTYNQISMIHIYDISDRSNPELLDTFKVSGSYYQSRMIDGMVYLVAQEHTYARNPRLPVIRSDERVINPRLYYFDNPETNHNFNTVVSIDVENVELVDSRSYLLGYANTLMVSEDAIYIAYQKNNYWNYYQQYEEERFYDVILPKLPRDLQRTIEQIIDEENDEQVRWNKISKEMGEFFHISGDSLKPKEEYRELLEEIAEALKKYDVDKALERQATVIHKLSIKDGAIDYAAKGEVKGSLLNQFSLDEHDGYLRVATTVNVWAREQIQFNNVFVLDEGLDVVGSIDNIAPDERIYSSRFMGDRLYLVTFKQVDPFFVIDLSDPRDPEILGELKLPGFSQYLHPYDENHVIGIGKDATDEGRVQGLKLALFDVSDVTQPRVASEVLIGDQGTDSLALHDHKAFLLNRAKGKLVIPVNEVDIGLDQYYRNRKTWKGAYVFSISTEGFAIDGKITHADWASSYNYWSGEDQVKRSLYLDNTLYTISDREIKMSDFTSLKEINSIALLDGTVGSPYYDEISALETEAEVAPVNGGLIESVESEEWGGPRPIFPEELPE